MKINRKELSDFGNRVAYDVIPFKRDQDVVKIGEFVASNGRIIPYASIVDGWGNLDKIPSNEPGRIVAERVSRKFPDLFLRALEGESYDLEGVNQLAIDVSRKMEAKVLSWYPVHASCVGTFIFELSDKVVVVAEGTISTLLWNGKFWEKPSEIGDYVLDGRKYESAAQRFFGRGELKNNPFYSVDPDTIIVGKDAPIFIATDGLLMDKAIMTLDELNGLSAGFEPVNPQEFIRRLRNLIDTRRSLQQDDISIFIKA